MWHSIAARTALAHRYTPGRWSRRIVCKDHAAARHITSGDHCQQASSGIRACGNSEISLSTSASCCSLIASVNGHSELASLDCPCRYPSAQTDLHCPACKGSVFLGKSARPPRPGNCQRFEYHNSAFPERRHTEPSSGNHAAPTRKLWVCPGSSATRWSQR